MAGNQASKFEFALLCETPDYLVHFLRTGIVNFRNICWAWKPAISLLKSGPSTVTAHDNIAEFVEHNEVPPGEIFGNPSLAAAARLGLKPVDEIDSVVKTAMFSGANATARDGYGEMCFSGAGSTDEDAVALLDKKVALSERREEQRKPT
jgi:hypothetical protein